MLYNSSKIFWYSLSGGNIFGVVGSLRNAAHSAAWSSNIYEYDSFDIAPTRDCTQFLKIGFSVFYSYYIHQGNKSDKERRKIVRKKFSFMHTKNYLFFFKWLQSPVGAISRLQIMSIYLFIFLAIFLSIIFLYFFSLYLIYFSKRFFFINLIVLSSIFQSIVLSI